MKVIVALISDPELEEYENPIDIKVRKCPPNYEQRYSSKQVEWIVELDDYTTEDIKEYFSNEDLIAWKEEHEPNGLIQEFERLPKPIQRRLILKEKEQFISLMHEEDA